MLEVQIMGFKAAQIEQLNTDNLLTAHRVSAEVDCSLIDASLRLTTALFPGEPTAAQGLGRAYEALMTGTGRIGDCELVEYFIYTTGDGENRKVVGGSGFYRLVATSSESDALLEKLRIEPPQSVSFLRNQSCRIHDFIWGGRLGIDPVSARSLRVMPFIIWHILSTATKIVEAASFAPTLLAFTLRENNQRVQQFYSQLGFQKTGATLEFAGELQDVFALNLSGETALQRRLSRMVQADKRRLPRHSRAA